MYLENYIFELSNILDEDKRLNYCFIGSVLSKNRAVTDVDIFSYENKYNPILENYTFEDGINLDVVTSLAVENYFNSDNKNLCELIFNDKRFYKLTSSGFKKLNTLGYFLTKLAAFEDRYEVEDKDLEDLIYIYNKSISFEENKNFVEEIIDEYYMDLAYDKFLELNK
jgi:subtilase family serine protease